MNKKYSKEGKRAKLLATLLTFSETDVNQRSPAGMTALHCALRVREEGREGGKEGGREGRERKGWRERKGGREGERKGRREGGRGREGGLFSH